ncbi:MAG: glycosyltransferase family A protein [Crocinitomicaceae bacterium]
MYKVSILLPNYNNAAYLRECFDSIFNQTLQDFKVIVIDDGSTDNSQHILKELALDKRVRLIIKDKNSGIVDTLNMGLHALDTKYVIRHDGDDLMHPERLEKMVDFMESNPEIGICGSSIECFGYYNEILTYPEDWRLNQANLIFGHSLGHASCIFRSEIFTEMGIRYAKEYPLMEDYDLFYRLKDKYKTTSIKEPLYLYRLTDAHDFDAIVKKKWDIYLKFYQRIMDDLGVENKEAAMIHLELSKNIPLTFDYEAYKDHVAQVKRRNYQMKLFESENLSQILDEKMTKIATKLIDQGGLRKGQILSMPKLWRYALSNKIKGSK